MPEIAVGLLHPGAMGVSIGAAAKAAGQRVLWLPEGRSDATAARAQEHGFEAAGSLGEMCQAAEVILSVCPPHAAEDVARAVAASGFGGLFVDGNAISPARTKRIAAVVGDAGARWADGGIVGPPAWRPGTCLYVSGPSATEVQPLFAGSVLEVQVLDDARDTASALKMVYAARTKGTAALLAATLAAAEQLGVRGHLEARLASEDAALPDRIAGQIRGAAPKAWRWIAEMEEIAATLAAAGSDPGFHEAAARVFAALAGFKDAEAPELEAILAALTDEPSRT